MFDTEVETSWTLQTGPVIEPLDLEELKAHLRITDSANDALVDSYGRAAREEAESYMGRGLLTQTWKYVLQDFAHVMPLPMAAPLQSVTSVKYYDADGTFQTLATSVYDVDTLARPGAVVLKPDQTWPTLQSERWQWRVEILYVVGWTTAEAVPERIKHGLRQFVAYLDLDRDGLAPQALAARQAAERCWSDRVIWQPPRC